MFMKPVPLILLASLILAIAAAPGLAQEKSLNPVTWSIKVVSTAPAGAALTAEVTAKIEDGWHLYSLTPIENGPRPTRILLPTAQAYELAGKIEAPEPFAGTDPNFGIEVEYYEELVSFKLPLKRRVGQGDSNPSSDKLVVEARYQTCTSQICLPPKTVKLEVEVK
jgi:thiol:disulfide interchange protein DsbD